MRWGKLARNQGHQHQNRNTSCLGTSFLKKLYFFLQIEIVFFPQVEIVFLMRTCFLKSDSQFDFAADMVCEWETNVFILGEINPR